MKTSAAVRNLRARLGISQQALSNRLGLAVRTVAGYEAGGRPTGKALVALTRLANENNYRDLADIFHDALCDELGIREWF